MPDIELASYQGQQEITAAINGLTLSAVPQKAVWFDTVADMKDADLPVGVTANTRGYRTVNDGGGATYYIREVTVSDEDDGGSVIVLDNENVAELIVGNTVYPQQFGAYCDRSHDDSAALQAAVNFVASKGNGIGVTINKDMLIDDTITVPMNVDISADINSNRYPMLYIGSNCTKVFDCVSKQCSFNAIGLKPTPATYRSGLIGWDFHGDSSYDADSALMNCRVQLMETGVVIRGRNVRVYDSFFGHCKYGVYYDFPSGATQLRGCDIKRCRFHGIGEEADLKLVDCSAIYNHFGGGTNITIQDCIADQGCAFFDGYASALLMSGNFVESFEGSLLKLEVPSGESYNDWVISNNVFRGKSGSTTYGETAGRPTNIISMTNCKRLLFSNNDVSYAYDEGIVLDTVINSQFSNNTFRALGQYDASNRFAFKLTSCTDITITNNTSVEDEVATNGIALCKSSDSSSAIIFGNRRFRTVTATVIPTSRNEYQQISTATTGVVTDLTHDTFPDGSYFVLCSNLGASWLLTKQGSYINASPFVTTSKIDYLYVAGSLSANPSTFQFKIKELTIASGTYTDKDNESLVIKAIL